VLRFATLRGLQLHLLSVLGDLWRASSSSATTAIADQLTATKPASPLAVTSLLEGQSLDKEFIALSVIVAALDTPTGATTSSNSSSAINSAAALNRAALAERVAAMRKSEKAAAIRVKRREIEALRRELRGSFTDTTSTTTAAAAADSNTDKHADITTAGASSPAASTVGVEHAKLSSTATAATDNSDASSSVGNQRAALVAFLAKPTAISDAAAASTRTRVPGLWAKASITVGARTEHKSANAANNSWHDSSTTTDKRDPPAAAATAAVEHSTAATAAAASTYTRVPGLWTKASTTAAASAERKGAEAANDSWHDSSTTTVTREPAATATAASTTYTRVPGLWQRAPVRASSPPVDRAQTADNSKSDAPLWCSDLPPRPRTAAISPRTSSDEGHNSSSSSNRGRVNSNSRVAQHSTTAVPAAAAVQRSADSKLRLSGSRNGSSSSSRLMAAPMHAAGLYESFDEQQHLAERPEDTALLRATQEDLQSYGMRAYAALRNRALLDDTSSSYEHNNSLSASQPNGLQRLLAADTSNSSHYSDVRASLGANLGASFDEVEPKRRQRVPSFATGALARISNSYLNSDESAAVQGGSSSARPASARAVNAAAPEHAVQQLSSARSANGSSSVTTVEPFVQPLLSPKQQQQQQQQQQQHRTNRDAAVLLQDIDAAELQELKAAVSPQYSSSAAAVNGFAMQRSTSPVTTETSTNTAVPVAAAAPQSSVNPWAVHSSATVRLSGGLAEQALTALLSPKSARSATAFDSRSPVQSPKQTVAAAAAAAAVPEVDTDYYDSGADEDTAAVLQASRTASSNGQKKPLTQPFAQPLEPVLQRSPPSPIESPLHSGRFARGFFLDGDNLTTWGTGASPSDHAGSDAGSDFADYDSTTAATAAGGGGATAGANSRVRSKLSAEEPVPATARYSDGCSDECSAASDDSGVLHSRQLTRSVSPVLVESNYANSNAQQQQQQSAAAVQFNYDDICVEDSLTEFPLLQQQQQQQQQQQHRAAAVGNVWQSADAWAALGLTDTAAAGGVSPTVEAEGSLYARAKPPREDLLVRMEVQRARELIEQQRRASGQRVTKARARVTVEALKRIKVVAAAAAATDTVIATTAASGSDGADNSADVTAGDTPLKGTPRTRPLRGWHTLKPTPLRVPSQHTAAQHVAEQHQHHIISNSSSSNSNNSSGRLQSNGQGSSKTAIRPPPPPPPRRSLRDATSAVRASAEFLLHANADAADGDGNFDDELIDSLASVEPAVVAVAPHQQQQQRHQQRQQYLRSRFGWKAAAGDSSSCNNDEQQQQQQLLQQQFSATTTTAPAYTASAPTHRTYAQARSSGAAVAAVPLHDRYSAADESYNNDVDVGDNVSDTCANGSGHDDALFSDGCYAEDSLLHYDDHDSNTQHDHDHNSNDYNYSSTAVAAAAALDNNSEHNGGASPRGESPVTSPVESPRAPLRFDISASSSHSAAIAGALQQEQNSAEKAASRAVRGAKFEARRAQKAAEMEQRRLEREDRQAAARQARLQAAAAERSRQAQAQAQLLEEAGLLADCDAPAAAAAVARSHSPERQYSRQQQQQQEDAAAHCADSSAAVDEALQLLPLQVQPFQRGSSAQSSRSRATPHGGGYSSSGNNGCNGPPSVLRGQQPVIAGASNRKLIRNAIMHLCLAGAHLETQKSRCIDALDAHPAMRRVTLHTPLHIHFTCTIMLTLHVVVGSACSGIVVMHSSSDSLWSSS
jgi:trimeric autotransporter adhesin